MELTKDILGIVYRYLVDYNYSRLKKQYKKVWLNKRNTLDRIFWNDNQNQFQTWDKCVANWRHSEVNYEYVRNFYTHKSSKHWN